MKAPCDLYLTSGRDLVVKLPDPRASFLLARAGNDIPKVYEALAAASLAEPAKAEQEPTVEEETSPEPEALSQGEDSIEGRVKRVPFVGGRRRRGRPPTRS